jgi:hypothetical protein
MKNIKSVLIICVFVLNGCAFSSKVWEPKIDEGEIAKDLRINEDGSKILVLGKKYNYLLNDDEKVIQNLVQWDGRASLKADVNAITAKGNEAEVRIILKADAKNLSEKQISFLIWLPGKSSWRDDKKTIMGLPTTDFKGVRYLSDSKTEYFQESEFSSTGFVKSEHKTAIFEDPTALQKTGKVLLTPFTLAADILLLPITIPYFIYHQVSQANADHFCEGEFCGYDRIPAKKSSDQNKTN